MLLFLISGCSQKPDKKEEMIYLLKTKEKTYFLLNETSIEKYCSKGIYSKDAYFKSIDTIKEHIEKNNLFGQIQPIQWGLPKLNPNIKAEPKVFTIELPWKIKLKKSIIQNLTYFSCKEMTQIFNHICLKNTPGIFCFGSNLCLCDYQTE